ncbi:uncharacterized protein LOC114966200 [Acropora millepora]|uniref:uncharacterized protein LOC114966200 n=1 Tax=Acropora millepora TaxID=45264 RepID=UPI0010FC8DC9|nr:uncharacterized protein LOC114966200 [Acropora millepora]
MASSSTEVGSLAVADPSSEEAVELSAMVKAIARENELDKALEAVLVKAQAIVFVCMQAWNSCKALSEQGICGNTKPSNPKRKFQPPQRRRTNKAYSGESIGRPTSPSSHLCLS